MGWFTAPSLLALTREVNELYAPPAWPTVSVGDGSVGDTSHSARVSSHNPLWSAPGKWSGVVRAVDIGIQGRDGAAVVKAAVGDPRVWYVIHQGVIWSRTYGWTARRYTGSNPHNHHVHVSLRETIAAWSDTRPWFASARLQPPKRVKPGPVNLTAVREQFLIEAAGLDAERRKLVGVKRIQYGLYHHVDKSIVVDGWVGPATVEAWRKWEREAGVSGRPGVPDLKTLQKFDREVAAITRVFQKPRKGRSRA